MGMTVAPGRGGLRLPAWAEGIYYVPDQLRRVESGDVVRCIADHLSGAANKPLEGEDWATYWELWVDALPPSADAGAVAWFNGVQWQYTTVAEIVAKSLGAENLSATDTVGGTNLSGREINCQNEAGTLGLLLTPEAGANFSNTITGESVAFDETGYTVSKMVGETEVSGKITADKAVALDGTSGSAPGASNKFLDNADSRILTVGQKDSVLFIPTILRNLQRDRMELSIVRNAVGGGLTGGMFDTFQDTSAVQSVTGLYHSGEYYTGGTSEIYVQGMSQFSNQGFQYGTSFRFIPMSSALVTACYQVRLKFSTPGFGMMAPLTVRHVSWGRSNGLNPSFMDAFGSDYFKEVTFNGGESGFALNAEGEYIWSDWLDVRIDAGYYYMCCVEADGHPANQMVDTYGSSYYAWYYQSNGSVTAPSKYNLQSGSDYNNSMYQNGSVMCPEIQWGQLTDPNQSLTLVSNPYITDTIISSAAGSMLVKDYNSLMKLYVATKNNPGVSDFTELTGLSLTSILPGNVSQYSTGIIDVVGHSDKALRVKLAGGVYGGGEIHGYCVNWK